MGVHHQRAPKITDGRDADKQDRSRRKLGIRRITGEPLNPQRYGEGNQPTRRQLGQKRQLIFISILPFLLSIVFGQ